MWKFSGFGVRGYAEKNSNTKTFMFVREPYSRLISGFVDKLVMHPLWWRMYGKYIKSTFGSQEEHNPCGHNVTFSEFIRYFISSQTTGKRQNIHFKPVNEICDV